MIQVKTNMGKMGKAGGSLAQEMEKEIQTDYFFTFLCPPAVKKLGGWQGLYPLSGSNAGCPI
jgi:hypothetical protein